MVATWQLGGRLPHFHGVAVAADAAVRPGVWVVLLLLLLLVVLLLLHLAQNPASEADSGRQTDRLV